MSSTPTIRRARARDAAAIAEIIVPTIREGCTYALDANMREADALAYWLAPDRQSMGFAIVARLPLA